MAVEKMKRAYIIAHQSHQNELLKTLQLKKIIDISDLQERVRHFYQVINLAQRSGLIFLSRDKAYRP